MKNLANCTPKEFLVQTNKIRKQAAHWMDITKVMEIRKNMPTLTGKETPEEKASKVNAQVEKNLNDMLDAALDANVDETVELLCLVCFIDPKDADNHTSAELIGNFDEIIRCPEVLSFFTSLMQLGMMNISGSAKT